MKIQKIKARNFLSIGDESLEIDFTKYGNIVYIKGLNLDVSPQSSNGAGKSTCLEAMVYGFYGKLVRGLNHKEAINKKTKKDLEVEVFFNVNDTNYQVIRKRKPDGLELYNLDKRDPADPSKPLNESRGGMPATQVAIEELIRLNCEAFVNVVCFGEHNNHAFLSLKAEEKRSIVENLLALEKYVEYCIKARKKLTTLDNKLKVALKEYDTLLGQQRTIEERIAQFLVRQSQWKQLRLQEIKAFEQQISQKQNELKITDDGVAMLQYQQAQEKINSHKDEIVRLETTRTKLNQIIEEEAQPRLDKLMEQKHELVLQVKDAEHNKTTLQVELKGIEEQNKKLSSLQDGVKCSVCYGKIDKSNYNAVLLHNTNNIEHLRSKIGIMVTEIPLLVKKCEENETKIVSLKASKKAADDKLLIVSKRSNTLLGEIAALAKVKEPNLSIKELLLNEQLKELEARLETKKDELEVADPYEELLLGTQEELKKVDIEISVCKGDMKHFEETIPYYEYWVQGFGDKGGIRSFIIDGILPALNARINYWLQFLIDNKIHLRFSRDFEPTIERSPPDGDPFVYAATSGGEKRRINLAISQAFAHVTALSANFCPSLISLDEIALNVDLQGAHGIFKMISELARGRQVLVTTHDVHLQELLENCDCDIINVVKEGGFTKLKTTEKKKILG